MKRRFIGLLGIALIGAVVLTGCSGGNSASDKGIRKEASKKKESKKETVDVGIILPTKDEPRWLQDQEHFGENLKKEGIKNQVFFSQGSSETEKKNIEKLIGMGMKVLIICSHDTSKAVEAVEMAKKAGVTIIAYDRMITGTDAVDYYISSDVVGIGEVQAKFLVDNIIPGTKLVPLYLYAGAISDNNSFVLFQGVWNVIQPKLADGTFNLINSKVGRALAKKPKLTDAEIKKIVTEITTDWDPNVAKTKISKDLAAVKPIYKGDVAVLAPNDGTARAMVDVLEADPKITSYVISGQDGEVASMQSILDGKQKMTLFKDIRVFTGDAVTVAKDVLAGNTPKTDAVTNNGKKDVPTKYVEDTVVDIKNVKEIISKSGYYDVKEFKGLE